MKNKRGIKNIFKKIKERFWELFSKITSPTWTYGSSNSAKQTNINLSSHYLNNWNIWFKLDLLSFNKIYILIDFYREVGRGRKKRETWISCILHNLYLGLSLQPQHVLWPRTKSVISQCMGRWSTNWDKMARDVLTSIIIKA